jgi:hypothetical protein
MVIDEIEGQTSRFLSCGRDDQGGDNLLIMFK